ncbi:hypothetical protein C789_2998 [Microcystis aeruginosa FACHB-905 = DIANCHI905]|nr:hypothetical protein C789_2998 [Microcystis aeruginosa FACHB-905 = DIANCHI905]
MRNKIVVAKHQKRQAFFGVVLFLANRLDIKGLFPVGKVINNRQIVYSQVSHGADIFLDLPQVHAHCLDVQQLAQIPGINRCFYSLHTGVVNHDVVHVNGQPFCPGDRCQFLRLGHSRSERLFHIHVFTGVQGILNQLVMGACLNSHGNPLNLRVTQQHPVIGLIAALLNVNAVCFVQSCLFLVANGVQGQLLVGEYVFRNVGAPVAKTNQSNLHALSPGCVVKWVSCLQLVQKPVSFSLLPHSHTYA